MPLNNNSFRSALLDSGVLLSTGVDGLYHRSGTFESVCAGVAQLASAVGSDLVAEVRHFPPVMPRTVFEQTDYLRSFPDLIGSISSFTGGDADHAELLKVAAAGGDWTSLLTPAETVLAPAVCHPLYPSLAGTLPIGGRTFEITGFAFRHEPSLDPARMQSFRMLEFVHVGTPESAVAHRDDLLDRGTTALRGLELDVEVVVANDPFFGRVGRMLAANQRESALKYEIVASITSEKPTAVSSANYHQDHFGEPFGIATHDGPVAHSSCFGFGLERIALALLGRHGLEPARWPAHVRHQLHLS